VFIGSSQQHLAIAKAVGSRLRKCGAAVTVWDEQVFVGNKSYLDTLLETFAKFDFSIFIWAPDDVTKSKESVSASTRDNVVLESGLALGIMGRQHVFIIAEKEVKIPSDFSGIAFADYDGGLAAKEPDEAVQSACNAISSAHRVHVVLGLLGPLGARSASEEVLFQRGQFGFVLDHAQIIPLKVMVGNVVPLHGE
jgi:predicted nucleotide-binding protein